MDQNNAYLFQLQFELSGSIFNVEINKGSIIKKFVATNKKFVE